VLTSLQLTTLLLCWQQVDFSENCLITQTILQKINVALLSTTLSLYALLNGLNATVPKMSLNTTAALTLHSLHYTYITQR